MVTKAILISFIVVFTGKFDFNRNFFWDFKVHEEDKRIKFSKVLNFIFSHYAVHAILSRLG